MPDSGRQALHTHVARLRAHLGPAAGRLQTRHDGYRLDLSTDELDLAQARTLLAAPSGTAGGPSTWLAAAARPSSPASRPWAWSPSTGVTGHSDSRPRR
jgi:hypothetical protein